MPVHTAAEKSNRDEEKAPRKKRSCKRGLTNKGNLNFHGSVLQVMRVDHEFQRDGITDRTRFLRDSDSLSQNTEKASARANGEGVHWRLVTRKNNKWVTSLFIFSTRQVSQMS